MKKQILNILVFTGLCLTANAQSNTFPATGNVGIGSNNPQVGLQIGELSGTYLDKQILIPGTYNFEQMRLGQMGNGNMGMEFVNHSGINSSFGIRWLVDVDHAPGLQIQYAADQTQYEALSYQTGFYMNNAGNIGMGTTNPVYKLDVIGTIRSREVKVDLSGADFVFEKDYRLMPLSELEKYIQTEKHLPEIATAKEMGANGVELGSLNSKLLQKVEELTLYVIEQEKKINQLETDDQQLKALNQKLLELQERLEKLEKSR